MPAKEGTGVIAGGPARAVLELAGLKDVRAKSLGSNNPRNMVNATINGLASLRTAEDIAKLRGKTVEEILQDMDLRDKQRAENPFGEKKESPKQEIAVENQPTQEPNQEPKKED